MHRSVTVLAVALVALATGSGSSALAGLDQTGPKQLSGGSPFADCAPGAIDDRKADGAIGPQLAADPHNPDVLYAVTPRFPTQERSRNHANISHSTDGGRSWGPARLLVDAGELHIASGHRLTVLGDGTLLDVYSLVDFRTSPSTKTLRAVRSTDSGLSWTAPIPVADLRTKFLFQDPESGEQVSHTTSLLGDTGRDPRTGRLYVAWQDSRFTDGTADSIALASSGGRPGSPRTRSTCGRPHGSPTRPAHAATSSANRWV